MSETAEQKIKVSVGYTARQVTEATSEAKRLGISVADVFRRWVDRAIDGGKGRLG